MNYDVRIMLEIYQTYEYDWFGDKITNIDKLTRHHIVKKEDGGENGISNYALLTSRSHNMINYLEENDVETFNKINDLFLKLNRSMQPVSDEYYYEIYKIRKTLQKKGKKRGR